MSSNTASEQELAALFSQHSALCKEHLSARLRLEKHNAALAAKCKSLEEANARLCEEVALVTRKLDVYKRWTELLPGTPVDHHKLFEIGYGFDLTNREHRRAEAPALHTAFSGRFGNNSQQLLNAVFMALHLESPLVLFPASAMVHGTVRARGLVVSSEQRLGAGCEQLHDAFFRLQAFGKAFVQAPYREGPLNYRSLARDFLAPLVRVDDAKLPVKDADLVVHIRSGDLFKGQNVHEGMAQPPFAYYVYSVERHLSLNPQARIHLVFEDRMNPVVDVLEEYLRVRNIPCRMQSSSLHRDYAFLLHARHLVTAYGTFCQPALLLNDKLGDVYCVAGSKATAMAQPMARLHLCIYDYLHGELWQNTPEQKQRMLLCPLDSLKFIDVPAQTISRQFAGE